MRKPFVSKKKQRKGQSDCISNSLNFSDQTHGRLENVITLGLGIKGTHFRNNLGLKDSLYPPK